MIWRYPNFRKPPYESWYTKLCLLDCLYNKWLKSGSRQFCWLTCGQNRLLVQNIGWQCIMHLNHIKVITCKNDPLFDCIYPLTSIDCSYIAPSMPRNDISFTVFVLLYFPLLIQDCRIQVVQILTQKMLVVKFQKKIYTYNTHIICTRVCVCAYKK